MILNCTQRGGPDPDAFTQDRLTGVPQDDIGACGECQNCRWITEGTHPRTPIYLSPNEDSHKQVIKIEQIRALQSELSQSSEFFRVIIIEDASSHCLNASSSAALLKTIEEARADTLFVLMAESKQSVLSTIVSRSQVFALNDNSQIDYDEVAKELAADLQEFLASNLASSRLQQLIKAEQVSSQENKDLIAALQILQNQSIGSKLGDAEQVMRYERAISGLKSFVRPQLVMTDLFS